ncbi:MAG: tryptophan 7-halogenase [Bryobacteraceae bacterium]|nr:tryptophan 7-halogenase [Bryobacteraceae bacterium]
MTALLAGQGLEDRVVASSVGSDCYCDVCVIGGGPAGSALATFLQRAGHRCLVLERSRFPRYHIGESLIPHTYGPLDRLGLLAKLRGSHFPEKHSVRFVSPEGTETDPFYFSETIAGEASRTWQVERSEFDQICLDNARENGVDVWVGVGAEEVLLDNGRAVGVLARSEDGERHKIRARVVADASGFATLIGSQLDLKEHVPGLHKAAVWSYYRGGKRLSGIDAGETTVFMLAQRGWFWYIPLPNDIVSVGVVASPDYLFDESEDFEPVFLREVERCRPLGERLRQAERTAPVRGVRRLAYRNRQIAGDGWVMVGDAAAFLDPIYSSGLFLALTSAELAAGSIHVALQAGDVSAARLGTFPVPLTKGVGVIRQLIGAFYDSNFSFRAFLTRYPEQRGALINCLVGDVIDKDMSGFQAALAEMTPATAF